ncbi:MAG: nucleotide pyrophosphohydrolase [Candidatus Thermoplasmatota archaeon]|nr:nucleotide pyrophosphohydrolase [Candidatus Thermoplasmatota archaeon]MBS3790005.1 nucleotide pyrophosphohydrolase [Candidatus Thermoplasmatota archaeon]
MVKIEDLKDEVKEFRDERNWKKYHTPKNLALSISVESAELLELFQWKEDSLKNIEKERLKEEMADIMIYLLAFSETSGVNLGEAVEEKLEKNKEKYPPEEKHFD